MKKKIGSVLLVGVVLVGVIGAGVLVYQNSPKEIKPQEGVIQKEECVELFKLNGNIARVEVKQDKTTILMREGNEWKNPGQSQLEYNYKKVREWIIELRKLESVEAIYGVQDLAPYGINDGSPLITIYDDLNESQTFRIGKNVGEKIYLVCDQIDGVFAVDAAKIDTLEVNLNDFVECQFSVPAIEQIGKIAFAEKGASSFTLQKVEDGSWVLADHYSNQYFVDEEKINAILRSLSEMKVDGFENIVTKDDVYGMAIPAYEVMINDTWSLSIGKEEKGKVYISQNHSGVVYRMKSEMLKGLIGEKPFDLISKNLFNATINELKEVTFKNPKGEYKLSIKTKEEAEPLTGSLNELELDEKALNELIEEVHQSIWIESALQNPEIEQKEERKAEISISYVLMDGTECKIELIPYDINYYILRYNGEIEFAVNKDKVTQLFSKLAHMTQK